MEAFIEADGGSPVRDKGNYAYYAGPVKVTAPGRCIEWGGFNYPGYLNFYSGWEHCG